mgnify:CR=1 FL=1
MTWLLMAADVCGCGWGGAKFLPAIYSTWHKIEEKRIEDGMHIKHRIHELTSLPIESTIYDTPSHSSHYKYSLSMSSNQYSHQMGFRATNHDRRHEGNGSSSSSRWVAPTKVHQHQPNHPSHTVAYTTQNTSDGRYVQHVDRENNYRHSEGGRDGGYAGGNSGGGGRQGGGKMGRQRRHTSNDTHHQRNLHRRPPPPLHKKNIITPTEIVTSSSSSQTLSTGPTSTESTAIKNNNINDDTPKLNPSIPAEARRISQRLRQVLFGKNTVGYEEYIKKVPKDKRRQRSLECPMTPDHRADIPAKRWQGLLNAW